MIKRQKTSWKTNVCAVLFVFSEAFRNSSIEKLEFIGQILTPLSISLGLLFAKDNSVED